MTLNHAAQSGRHALSERDADQHCARNVAQRGDALALLHSLPDSCARLVFFDPQHRENLDKLKYGNEGARQRERCLLPAMTSGYIDECCFEIARVLMPRGYLMLWQNAFGLVQGHHLRVADVLQCVDLIAWDNQRPSMGYRARRRGDYLKRAIDVREESIRRHDARRRLVNHTQRRNKEVIMTLNLKKYGPINRWLKLEDFHGKPPRQERIGCVRVENGKYGERVVLVFEPSGQMLSLNQTSVGNLLRDLGPTDDDWAGRLVEICAGEVETKSGPTDAILVRGVTDAPADAAIAAKAVKAAKAAKAAKKASDDMDDTIPF